MHEGSDDRGGSMSVEPRVTRQASPTIPPTGADRPGPVRSPDGRLDYHTRLKNHLAGVSAMMDFKAPKDAFDEATFVDSFIAAVGKRKSAIAFRGAINHFLRWAKSNSVPVERFGCLALERFRLHRCSVPTNRKKPYSPTYIGRIARFIVYLQYQARMPDWGWGSQDVDRCLGFEAALLTDGMRPDRAARSAVRALHYIMWLRLRGVSPWEITEEVCEEFSEHHCHCGIKAKRSPPDRQQLQLRRASMDRFRRFLAGEPVILDAGFVRRRLRPSPIGGMETVAQYAAWMTRRNYSPMTRQAYLGDLVMWLPHLGEDAENYSALSIREAVLAGSSSRTPSMQGRCVRSVRNYLRFRIERGDCKAELAGSLISRPTTAAKPVPRYLAAAAVNRAIDSCDRKTAQGLRDRAVLLLLAELGLRGVEVWRLQIEDIDWHNATLSIRGKGGRGATMPLTQRSGDAILAYLRHARPPSQQAALFVRDIHPHVAFANASEISNIARKAFARSGIEGVGGSHAFRHSLATSILRSGQTLQAVATVLRHQSLDSTMIYAKVDDRLLRAIARPWPEAGHA